MYIDKKLENGFGESVKAIARIMEFKKISAKK